jgi:NADPH:quinone reductase-like Zn-dependent oxidoreductase
MPALKRGAIRPIIDSVYPLRDAAAAQERMRANEHFGKIVLRV